MLVPANKAGCLVSEGQRQMLLYVDRFTVAANGRVVLLFLIDFPILVQVPAANEAESLLEAAFLRP